MNAVILVQVLEWFVPQAKHNKQKKCFQIYNGQLLVLRIQILFERSFNNLDNVSPRRSLDNLSLNILSPLFQI